MSSTTAELTFFDTNVLVYMFDSADIEKQDRALEAFASVSPESAVISAQVLSEFANAMSRIDDPLADDDLDATLASFARLTTVALTAELVIRARALRRRFSLSQWDAQIVAAAEHAGCTRLMTEDLQHGQVIGDLAVVDPFVRSAD